MGLRVTEGIDLTRYAALAGREIDSSKIAGLKSHGTDQTRGPRLQATRRGRQAAQCADCRTGGLGLLLLLLGRRVLEQIADLAAAAAGQHQAQRRCQRNSPLPSAPNPR